MQQQTRLDEFFKVTRSSNTQVTQCKIKEIKQQRTSLRRNFATNKRRKKRAAHVHRTTGDARTDKSLCPLDVCSVEMSDCEILYEKHCTDPMKINENSSLLCESEKKELTQIKDFLECSLEMKLELSENERITGCIDREESIDSKEILLVHSDSPIEGETKTELHSQMQTVKSESGESPRKREKYTPKRLSLLGNSVLTNKGRSRSLFKETIDTELLFQTIEHLNLAKQGAIPANNFDLESIYNQNSFKFSFNNIDTKTSTKYELADVVTPKDMYAKQLFMIIINVFYNPINCGYFNENELDFIFCMLTLSERAQMLFARMIKRQHTWHRLCILKYPDVGNNLRPVCEELVSHSICTSNTETEGLRTLLGLLQVDEIREICQKMKTSHGKRKENLIEDLLKLNNKSKPLFPGMKGPSGALQSLVIRALGYCVRLTDKAVNIFDKMINLLFPDRDPQQSVSDMFFMLQKIHTGNITYPEVPRNTFPIFSNMHHLSEYIEAKNILTKVLNAIVQKDWEAVRKAGQLAYDRSYNLFLNDSESCHMSVIPPHVKYFEPSYMWLKIMSKTIDAFKKSREYSEAIKLLQTLISQKDHMQSRKGKWYTEWVLIEVHHKKQIEVAADIILDAPVQKDFTDVDKIEFIMKAQKLANRKSGITSETRARIQKNLTDEWKHLIPTYTPVTNTIQATVVRGNTSNKKSTWCINNGADYQAYGTVEDLALYHYCQTEFNNGVHCEGALPITVFATLFWEELYGISIPGVWVSMYQVAPLDLYTDTFYENRKEQIDTKLQLFNCLTIDEFCELIEHKFDRYCKYSSLLSNAFTGVTLKEIVQCLEVKGIIGICKRMIDNYKLWKAGFPDLIVWNSITKRCKVIEVKGPGDTPSTKQLQWLKYLQSLNIDAEICVVEGYDETTVLPYSTQIIAHFLNEHQVYTLFVDASFFL